MEYSALFQKQESAEFGSASDFLCDQSNQLIPEQFVLKEAHLA